MAVTAGQEYGLFIGGEVVEPASGEIRDLSEPATGEPLARAAMAGEADVDRAVEAARAALDGPWGKTPPNERARAPARARRRDRGEPQGARGARVAQRRQGDLLGQGRGRGRGRELPLLRLGRRLDRRPLEPDRRLAAQLHAQGAGRRLCADRALELPAAHVRLEALAGARGGLRRRAQAGPADAAQRAADRRARDRGRLPGRRDQHRPGGRPDDRLVSRQAPGRRQGRVHRLDARRGARSCGSAPSRSSASRSSSAARAPTLVFADANLDDAIPSSVWSIYYAAGQSCEARSRVLVGGLDLRRLRRALRRGGEAAQGRRPARPRDPGRLAHLRRRTATACTATSRRARGGSRGRGRRRARRRRGRLLSRRRCWPESTPR